MLLPLATGDKAAVGDGAVGDGTAADGAADVAAEDGADDARAAEAGGVEAGAIGAAAAAGWPAPGLPAEARFAVWESVPAYMAGWSDPGWPARDAGAFPPAGWCVFTVDLSVGVIAVDSPVGVFADLSVDSSVDLFVAVDFGRLFTVAGLPTVRCKTACPFTVRADFSSKGSPGALMCTPISASETRATPYARPSNETTTPVRLTRRPRRPLQSTKTGLETAPALPDEGRMCSPV